MVNVTKKFTIYIEKLNTIKLINKLPMLYFDVTLGPRRYFEQVLCVRKNNFLISQPKHMLWVLNETVQ